MTAPATPAVPGGPDSRPVPDPTVLTTQLVDRATAAFREVMDTRLTGMDRATELLSTALERYQADTRALLERIEGDIDRRIKAALDLIVAELARVEAVTDQRFLAGAAEVLSIKSERDRTAEDSKVSLKAAFDAAALAVAEKNKANDEKIATAGETARRESDNFVTLMTTSVRGLEDKITDIKERIDKGEGTRAGTTEARTERRLDVGQTLLAVSVVIAAIAIVVTLVLSRGI